MVPPAPWLFCYWGAGAEHVSAYHHTFVTMAAGFAGKIQRLRQSKRVAPLTFVFVLLVAHAAQRLVCCVSVSLRVLPCHLFWADAGRIVFSFRYVCGSQPGLVTHHTQGGRPRKTFFFLLIGPFRLVQLYMIYRAVVYTCFFYFVAAVVVVLAFLSIPSLLPTYLSSGAKVRCICAFLNKTIALFRPPSCLFVVRARKPRIESGSWRRTTRPPCAPGRRD